MAKHHQTWPWEVVLWARAHPIAHKETQNSKARSFEAKQLMKFTLWHCKHNFTKLELWVWDSVCCRCWEPYHNLPAWCYRSHCPASDPWHGWWYHLAWAPLAFLPNRVINGGKKEGKVVCVWFTSFLCEFPQGEVCEQHNLRGWEGLMLERVGINALPVPYKV